MGVSLSASASRKPSPSSTTLEDVLDSLLGLPSSTRAPSPSLQETASASTSPVRQRRRSSEQPHQSAQYRRKSEGSEPTSRPGSGARRASFHATSPPPPLQPLRCRYSRCGRSAPHGTHEARQFKNCHNCSYTYCSKTCRRAHWEKHRRTCLFSRVGALCRQVIAAAKAQEDALKTLSIIARRGYLSQGLGAVKIFFPCPDAAEQFLSAGLSSTAEPTYIRWADLLPSEMGPQLYAELVRMCKSYNPDARLVLYVSVCVVSEAPAAGAVKWERQLVSRCGKMRLSRQVRLQAGGKEEPQTVILTSAAPAAGGQQQLRVWRERCSASVQRHLSAMGVDLKKHHPTVLSRLEEYTETGKFAAATVYPKDITKKTLMCIVMPEADTKCVQRVASSSSSVKTIDVMTEQPRPPPPPPPPPPPTVSISAPFPVIYT